MPGSAVAFRSWSAEASWRLHVLVDAGDGRANLIQERARENADAHDQHQERSHAGDLMPADRLRHTSWPGA